MKRKPLLWTLAGLILLALIFFPWPKGPAEPAYQGKKLSQWMEEAFAADERDSREPMPGDQRIAKSCIQAMGTNALPWLMHEFTRPRSKWKAGVDSLIARHTKWDFRLSRDLWRRHRARQALVLLGPDLAPALPALARSLDDPDKVHSAIGLMAAAGEKAVPYLAAHVNPTNANSSEKSAKCYNVLLFLARSSDLSARLAASNALDKFTNAVPATPPR